MDLTVMCILNQSVWEEINIFWTGSNEKLFIAMQHKDRILLTAGNYQSLAGILFLLLLIASCSEDLNTSTIIEDLDRPDDISIFTESEDSCEESIFSTTTTDTAANLQHGLAQKLSKKFPDCEEAQKLCEFLRQDSTNELAGNALVDHRTSSLEYAVICFHLLGADSAEYLAPIIQNLIDERVAMKRNIQYQNTHLSIFDTALALRLPTQTLQTYLNKKIDVTSYIINKLSVRNNYSEGEKEKLLTVLVNKNTRGCFHIDSINGDTILHFVIKDFPEIAYKLLRLHRNKDIDLQWHLKMTNKLGQLPWEVFRTKKGYSLALQLFCETIPNQTEVSEESLMWLVDDKKSIKNAYSIIRGIKNNEKLGQKFKEMLIQKIVRKLPEDGQRVYQCISTLNKVEEDESDIALKNKLIELCSLSKCTSDMYDNAFLKKIIAHKLLNKKILELLQEHKVSFKALLDKKNINATIKNCRSLSTLIWLFKDLGIPKDVAIYKIIFLISLNPYLKSLEASELAKIFPEINKKCPVLKEKLSDILCNYTLQLEKNYRDKWRKYLEPKKSAKKCVIKKDPAPLRISRREDNILRKKS